MKRKLLWLLVGIAGVLVTIPAGAHHPVATVYFSDRTLAIQGTLVEILFRNPHSLVFVEAPDGKGQLQRWTVEWLAVLQLNRQGVTSGILKAGDRVSITGYPARNSNEHQLRLRTIVRPKDGWTWGGTFE